MVVGSMLGNQPSSASELSTSEDAPRAGGDWALASAIERAAPLLPVAGGMILGIASDSLLRIPPRVAWVAFVFLWMLGLAAFLRFRRRSFLRTTGLCAAAVGVGGLLHLDAQRLPRPEGILSHLSPESSIVRLRGTIATSPRTVSPQPGPFARWSFRRESTRFEMRVESIESADGWTVCRDRVHVVVREPILDLREGETVVVGGFLGGLTSPQNPGEFDWSQWQRRRGIGARLTCPHRDNVQRADPMGIPREPWIQTLRRRAAMLIAEGVVAAEEESGLLDALVLGQRSEIHRAVSDAFEGAGCIHFLAASGTNVAMVASFAWLIARWVRLTRRGSALVVFGAIVLYVLLAEPRPPILRAAVTGTLFCIAIAVGRGRAVLNWLSAAAIVLLAFDPATAFDVGFQLSFLAVLGVTYLSRPVSRLLTGERRDDHPLDVLEQSGRWRWMRRGAVLYLGASMGAWLAGLPVVAGVFHRVQPYGAIGSCMALPLVYLAMLVGFLRATLGLALPVVQDALGTVLRGLVGVLLDLVSMLSRLPGASLDVSPPPWWWTMTYYAAVSAFAFHGARSFKKRTASIGAAVDSDSMPSPASPARTCLTRDRRNRAANPSLARTARLACFAFGIAGAVATVAWAWPRDTSPSLTMTVLSVGEGSAAVLELPTGETVLVDAGSRSYTDVGHSVVEPFLRIRGLRSVDEAVLTGAKLSRFNGLPTALESSSAVAVRVPPGFLGECAQKASCRELLKLLDTRGHRLRDSLPAEASWPRGDVEFGWLSFDDAPTGERAGEASTALRIRFAGRTILYAPDLDPRNCHTLADATDLHVDVLIAPAASLGDAQCKPFLDAAPARSTVAIRSVRQEAMDEDESDVDPSQDAWDTRSEGAMEITLTEEAVRVRPASRNGGG